MKYRIKSKNNKYYPQKKILWWYYFYTILATPHDFNEYTKEFFNTLQEAKEFVCEAELKKTQKLHAKQEPKMINKKRTKYYNL